MNPAPKPNGYIKYSVLLHNADQAFSRFIRQRDKNICITCGKQGTQNGHYISRASHGTRFDERNCNCQCENCNCILKGNLVVYKQELVKLYGFGILAELDLINKINHKKTSIEELNRILNYYNNRE